MARWTIKNVTIKGVAMAVPEHVVKTSDYDFFSQEEADVFDKTVGIKQRRSCWLNWDGNAAALIYWCLSR